MRALPLSTRLYIVCVSLAGAVLLGFLFPANAFHAETLATMALFGAIVLLADLFPVCLPWGAIVSVSAAVNFALVVLFGVGWGCWVGAVAVGLADIILRKAWFKAMFNATGTVLWTGLAGLTYEAIYHAHLIPAGLLPIEHLDAVLGTAGYAAVNFVVNSLVVALVIALSQGLNVWQVWLVNFKGLLLQFSAMIPMGALIVVTYSELRELGLLLVALPLVMLYYSFRNSQELRQQTIKTIEYLADVVDKRDPYTFEHSKMVSEYAEQIALRLNLSLEETTTIVLAARVHDLGKIAIRDNILLKPGPLTPEERKIMESHAILGGEMVQHLSLYSKGRELITCHHERYDGKGYPSGKTGKEMQIGARIMGVADSYQAMTSDRPYRKAMPISRAVAELKAGSGTQFDPVVVEAFLDYLQEMHPEEFPSSSPELQPA